MGTSTEKQMQLPAIFPSALHGGGVGKPQHRCRNPHKPRRAPGCEGAARTLAQHDLQRPHVLRRRQHEEPEAEALPSGGARRRGQRRAHQLRLVPARRAEARRLPQEQVAPLVPSHVHRVCGGTRVQWIRFQTLRRKSSLLTVLFRLCSRRFLRKRKGGQAGPFPPRYEVNLVFNARENTTGKPRLRNTVFRSQVPCCSASLRTDPIRRSLHTRGEASCGS